MTFYLVYVPGFRGPTAKIWSADYMAGNDGAGRTALAKFTITPEESAMPLNNLMRKYPFPKEKK